MELFFFKDVKNLLPAPALDPRSVLLEKNLNHPRNHVGDTIRCSLFYFICLRMVSPRKPKKKKILTSTGKTIYQPITRHLRLDKQVHIKGWVHLWRVLLRRERNE
jgi:hypothetical protein